MEFTGMHAGGTMRVNSTITRTATLVFVSLAMMMPALPALAAADPIPPCPLANGIIVDFPDEQIRSDRSLADAQSDLVSVVLLPGRYQVTLASYDHVAEGGDQPNEQWFLYGLDSAGATTFSTPPIADIPGNVNSMIQTMPVFFLDSRTASVGAQHAFHPDNTSTNSVYPWCVKLVRETPASQLQGDFNGDGKDDVASFYSSDGTWWVTQSTGTGFSTTLWADYYTAAGWGPQVVGDFNGDGKDDIANFHNSNGTWWVSSSTGSGFTTRRWATLSRAKGWGPQLVGDFNGDGKDDIANFHDSDGTWQVSRSTGTAFATSLWADFYTTKGWDPQLVGDFNGDGKDDIVNLHSGGRLWVSRSTGTSFSTTLWGTVPVGWGRQRLGDYDGDGKDDLAGFYGADGTWRVARSTGTGFTTKVWADFSTTSGWNPQMAGDFTGDGKDDIANYHSSGTWWVSRSTGASFSTTRWTNTRP
jgi:hypothetical protein